MKASTYSRYGGPEMLQLTDVAQPTPIAGEVLVKVHATTVTAADLMMRTGKPKIGRLYLGISKPKKAILGFDFAGEIVAVGPAVTTFSVGQQVFGGTTALGCYAEYVCVKAEDVITTIPENCSFEMAAPISGSGITALHFLQGLAKVKAGDRVLIYGGSGAVGTYAVQIAHHLGAVVTAVSSAKNAALMRELGAAQTIDYTTENFRENGQQYDVIFDAVGKLSFRSCKNSLAPKGIYLSTVMGFGLLGQMIWTGIWGGKRAKTASTGMLPARERLAYLLTIRELLAKKSVISVIDHVKPLSEMAEAHAFVEQGHKKGNLVIQVA